MTPHVEGAWHFECDQTHNQNAISQQEPCSSQTPLQRNLETHQSTSICININNETGNYLKQRNNNQQIYSCRTYNDHFLLTDETTSIFRRLNFSRSRTTLFLQIFNDTIGLAGSFVLLNSFSSISQYLNCGETPNLILRCQLFICFFIGINFRKNNRRVMTAQFGSSFLILKIIIIEKKGHLMSWLYTDIINSNKIVHKIMYLWS